MEKQTSWAAKRPGLNRQAPWQSRHRVEKPAEAWLMAFGSEAVRS
jgi:hypothetical protein